MIGQDSRTSTNYSSQTRRSNTLYRGNGGANKRITGFSSTGKCHDIIYNGKENGLYFKIKGGGSNAPPCAGSS